MDFEWTKLDLRRATSVCAEVEKVAQEYASAQSSGDDNRVRILKEAIVKRIEELGDFYLSNDTDPRAVLFEKQRLALRKIMRETKRVSTPRKTPVPTPPKRKPRGPSTPAKQKSQTPSPATPPPKKPVESAPKEVETPKKKIQTPKRKPQKVGPAIYQWEARSTPTAPKAPLEGRRKALKHVPGGSVEFLVKLTEAEMQALMTRRRALMAEKQHLERMKTDRSSQETYTSISATESFIEPTSLREMVLRNK